MTVPTNRDPTASPELEDVCVLSDSVAVGVRDTDKSKEEVEADSASLEVAPSPTFGEFPDGGLAAWLVVVGVCALLTSAYPLR